MVLVTFLYRWILQKVRRIIPKMKILFRNCESVLPRNLKKYIISSKLNRNFQAFHLLKKEDLTLTCKFSFSYTKKLFLITFLARLVGKIINFLLKYFPFV